MIRFATSRPAVMWALSVALLLAGGIAFTRLPLATRTSVELPRLSITAYWPGAAPEVIETYLTSPIEAAAQAVRGVKRVSSTSADDFANLTVELEPRADVQMARLAILERLELLRGDLPPGASAPSVSNFVPEGLEETPLLSLTVSGPYTAGTLQQLLDEQVQPRLASVPGVAGVVVRGGIDRGVSVSYEATRLRQLGIPPQRLSDAINGARVVQALGDLSRGAGDDRTVRPVVLRDQPASLEALQALPIVGAGGRLFRLGELATIRADEDARGRFFRINGTPAVSIEVTRHPGADAIKTAALLRASVAELTPQMPPGVQLKVSNDQSTALAEDLGDLTRRGAIAFGSVLLVLALLMRRWRAVAVIMGSTLVAIAATALTLYVLGVPANLLTLAGLGMGVGILVQNAIVVVERLQRVEGTADARAECAGRMAPAVIGSTLTTAVVLVPFLYLQGNARAAFVPFAAAFVIALGWSVVAALLIVPAVGARVGIDVNHRGAGRRGSQEGGGRTAVARWYRRVVLRSLRWRWVTLTAAVVLVAGSGYLFIAKVPRSSFGNWGDRRTTLSVGLSFPRGSDPATLDAAMREFETLVVGRPEVEQVRASSRGAASAQMSVLFTRAGGFTAVPLELQELLTQRAVLVGGASVSVFGEGPGFSSGGGGGGFASFRMQVKGFSYSGVQRIAEDIKARLEGITRVRDVRITSGGWFGSEKGYQVTLTPDRAALARYGLTAAQLTQAVSREVRGPVGRQLLEIGGDELPVTVKAAGARERSLDELQVAQVPTATNAPVRLGDVALVSEREALTTVVREDQQYLRHVSYDFRGPARLARRTHTAFVKALSAPAGYAIVDLSEGTPFEQDQSERGLWLVFAIGIALVVLAVALVFDSVWGAVVVFLSLPLALTGVVAAFLFAGAPFTREAAVGVILVVGLAVNQAILLVDAALERRRITGSLTARDVVHATRDRAGMIVVVTLAALASLVPLSVGTGATTLFGAIALATAGGTLAGTIAVLVFVPAMMVGRRRDLHRRRVGPPRGVVLRNPL